MLKNTIFKGNTPDSTQENILETSVRLNAKKNGNIILKRGRGYFTFIYHLPAARTGVCGTSIPQQQKSPFAALKQSLQTTRI